MTPKEAKETLLLHSFSHHELAHPKMAGGFLGSLRPYIGLNPENLHEVMMAIRVLAPELGKAQIERKTISALWAICHFARSWGVDPEGMLRRNNLIDPEDIERLNLWIEAISYAVTMLLDGSNVTQAFELYNNLEQQV